MLRLSHAPFSATLLLATLGAAPLAAQQVPDARPLPRGALRISFTPFYTSYDHFFDSTGTLQPLGTYYSADSLGVGLLPTLNPAQDATRTLADDGTYTMTAGRFRARFDADLRRFPFQAALGVSDRLTLTATLPLVTTRVNSSARYDSASANVGWNQLLPEAGNADAAGQVTALLNDLATSIVAVNAQIAGGAFGCPGSAACQQAQAVVVRAQAAQDAIERLTGLGITTTAGTTPPPPFAPLATSAAGQAITSTLAKLDTDLKALGAPGLAETLPLPTTPPDSAGIQSILTTSAYGYGYQPLGYTKLSGLGDAELGARYGLVQRPHMRVLLGGTVRLPTGVHAATDALLPLATGNRQWGFEGNVEAALEPGRHLGLWLDARYAMQLPNQLRLRVTPVTQPITLASQVSTVNRHLGSVLTLSAYPSLRLTDEFQVFTTVSYYHKGADRYTTGSGSAIPGLDAFSAQHALSFGAGAWYRSYGRKRTQLPVEAGVTWQTAFVGGGGFAPKSSMLHISLRFYYHLWGGPPAPAPADTAASSAK